MTKRVRSDRRQLDVRPVSQMSADATDNRSRYEEVSRQFAHEFPQMAWDLGQRPRTPWFLSPRHMGRQGNKNTASGDEDNGLTAADSSTGCDSDHDSEVAPRADRNSSMYDDGAYNDALYIAMTTSASSPDEQTGDPASPTSPDTGFDPSCDLEALALRLLWQNQTQELRYRRATQIRDQEQARPPEHSFTQPVERRESRQSEIVEGDRLDQIMSDLGKLGVRLREDARRQLDVISDDSAALPLCL